MMVESLENKFFQQSTVDQYYHMNSRSNHQGIRLKPIQELEYHYLFLLGIKNITVIRYNYFIYIFIHCDFLDRNGQQLLQYSILLKNRTRVSSLCFLGEFELRQTVQSVFLYSVAYSDVLLSKLYFGWNLENFEVTSTRKVNKVKRNITQ